MADNILKGIIKLEVQGAEKLSLLERQFKAFGGLKPFSQNIVPDINKIPPAINNVEQSLKKLPNASNQATQSLSNLSRVAQDAPYGFIGIANNLNPLLESFQRLKETTGSTGGALKALGSSLTGPGGIGLALGVVSSLLVVFGDNLFGSSSKVSDFNLKLAELSDKSDQLRLSVKNLNTELDFLQKIGNLTVDFNFGDAGERSILKARIESVRFDDELAKVSQTAQDAKKNLDAVFDLYINKGSDAARQLVNSFGDIKLVPDAAIENLKKKDREVVSAYKQSAKDLIDFQEQVDETRNKRDFARASIRLALKEEERRKEKEALEKSKSDYDKYVSETISKAKSFASQMKDIFIVPVFTVFDTKSQELEKAKKFLADFYSASLTVKIPIKVSPDNIEFPSEESKPIATEFGTMFYKELNEYFKNTEPTDFTLLKVIAPKLKTQAEILADDLGRIIANGFGSGFESIGEGIGNALSGKGFGAGIVNVIGDLLSQIGKALVSYGIIKSGLDKILGAGGIVIPGAVAIGLGISAIAFGQIFKNFGGARALGGPVSSGKSYLVGENGPEIFNPSVNGNIIPNNRLGGNYSGGSGFGGRVVFEIAGNKLIGVLARGNKSQNFLS